MNTRKPKEKGAYCGYQ